MEQQKQKYKSAQISSTFVELESGIAQSSATVSGGENSSNEYTPAVDPWGAEQSTDTVRGEL
ncbi:hypothetical protein [Sphingobacterium sp. BN32]|uniref:hypothetical protein n=1 Tax=Sphingobacterium sp. BN32 TaxID=3058432 RepID=UPI00265D1E50|nr:hypothetical protein [Sphingobacterium sp. BN32]WKK58746.1 hypothetical protein QYC40_00620 [Sphingobacterium sp. BN32]